MRTLLRGIIAALLAVGFLASVSFGEEELFDTKAAAAHMEKGIHLLKAKKIDAAVQEFEDAVAAAPEAEAYYLLGYAYYLKSKSGDEDARQKSIENFEMAYQINPNFTPSKFKPTEPITVPAGKPSGDTTPAALAPASKLAPPAPAAPATPAAPQNPPTP